MGGGLERLVKFLKSNRKYKIAILVLVLLISVGGSYAFIKNTIRGKIKQKILASNLVLILEEEKNLNITDALPIYDEVGMIQKPYNFTVINKNNVPLNYIVRLVDVTIGERLDTSIVRYGLTKKAKNKIDNLSSLKNNELDSGVILGKESIHYSLRIWIDSSVEDEALIKNKGLSYKVEVEIGQILERKRTYMLEPNSGKLDTTSVSVVIGEKYGKLPEPTRLGYQFVGWQEEDGNLIQSDTYVRYLEQTLTAKWEIGKYQLTFNPDGGSVDVSSKIVTYNETYGELPIPTKTGYNFLGWLIDGKKIESDLVVTITSNQTANASWSPKRICFTYDGYSSSKCVPYGYGYGFVGNLLEPTKAGYTFQGWYTEPNGGVKIENSTPVTIDVDHNLYPRWTKDLYIDASGASRPVIKDELIPVKIASNGTVTKADIAEKWYDYNAQEWANAVILLDKTINYSEGQTIPESNIESYFAWIPRFKYKIFNTGNYTGYTSIQNSQKTIEIEFENKNISASNGTTVGLWLTHPAFTTLNTNGIWVGKFESSYKGAKTTTEAEANSYDATKLQMKPNVYSWRSLTLGNMFKISYDYKRNLESHMMKNTEWGAVAYLSHSKYGKQDAFSQNTVIYHNNNNLCLTGCGGDGINEAATAICKNAYGSKIDNIYNQSTTGNISGIFDMSGGAWEYVMGYNTKADTIGGQSTITTHYSDLFTNSTWNKYYDRYSSIGQTAYNSRILGDATGELGPFNKYQQSSWYNNLGNALRTNHPWMARGGGWANNGPKEEPGIFNFSPLSGESHELATFRITLSPE